MARVPVLIMVADPATGNALSGVSATVKNRVGGSNVTLYAAETGPTTVGNPLTTDSYGRAQAWADRAAFQIDYAGTGLTSWTEYRDLGPSSDGGIDAPMIPDAVIGYSDLMKDASGLAVGSFRAGRVAAATINNATETTIIYDTDNDAPACLYDISAAYNTATGVYTAPVKGLYAFYAAITMAAALGAGSRCYLALNKNGVIVAYLDQMVKNGATYAESLGGHARIPLAAGDTVYVSAFQDSGSARSTGAGAASNWFEGHVVGLLT